VIVPVISFDAKYLYFDRKEHPENTGGIKDVDEIWFSERKMGKYWSEPKKLDSWLNTVYPDVLFSILPDGRKALVYGHYYKGIKTRGFSIVERNENEFSNPKELHIKNYENHSNNFYGSLSTNSDILLISMKNDMCMGGEDIFVTFHNYRNDTWTEFINLGSTINTMHDETSAILAYDGKTLYFASLGHKGYGDYDLFMSKRLDNSWTNWTEPVNLGKSINSKFKETGFSLTLFSDSAYIISSEYQVLKSMHPDRFYDSIDLRHGIYSVCIPKEFQPEPYTILKGKVTMNDMGEQIPISSQMKFKVKLNNDFHNDFLYSTQSGDGSYLFIIPCNSSANIELSAEGFEEQFFNIRTDTLTSVQLLEMNFEFKKIEDLTEKPISLLLYYNFNEFKLTSEQKQEISNFITSLDSYKNLNITISGHTDEIGTLVYNLTLSQKRASEVAKLLKELGINSKKIQIQAKGNTEPISTDANLNRRVEISIIKK
jgi:outer membrane protein OmpA-like peptidoglycan-associated protein